MTYRLLAPISLSLFLVSCQQSDPAITQMVRAALKSDDLVRTRDIIVETRQQVVTLTGSVASAAERQRATRLARFSKGVNEVVDQLRIEPEAVATTGVLPAKVAIDDATITAAINTKLLADPETAGLHLDVRTRDRVVTLRGAVHAGAEHEGALVVAKTTDGVTRVNDQLEVSP